MPTLVIYGAEDKIVPPKQHILWQKNLNGVQTKLLPNVGHLPHVEAPDQTADLIHSFLGQN
jgi:pimeloyl-ACP methyl ester carboxylesterase